MRQCLEAKFVDAHENLCDSVGGLQLVLAVMVFGKEGSERDKSTHLFLPCSFHSSLHFVYSYLFQIPPF
jgi:hypothetical protein